VTYLFNSLLFLLLGISDLGTFLASEPIGILVGPITRPLREISRFPCPTYVQMLIKKNLHSNLEFPGNNSTRGFVIIMEYTRYETPLNFDTEGLLMCRYWNRLGNSGLYISKVILGTASFGSSKWQEWVLEEKDALPLLKHAFDCGINTWDTVSSNPIPFPFPTDPPPPKKLIISSYRQMSTRMDGQRRSSGKH
jgi:hypothetical protein